MSLRDRFREESLPTQTVPLPADRAAWDAAHMDLQTATAAVQQARRRGAPPQELLDRESAAQTAIDELQIHHWVVRTLEADEWEALVSAHPAAPEAEHGWAFDPASFHPALLAETVTLDGDSDDAEWWTAPKGIGPAVRQYLINVAMALNGHVSVVSDAVGKGWPATRS